MAASPKDAPPVPHRKETSMQAESPERHGAGQGELGQARERIEDLSLLRGHGRYGDDLPVPPGTLQAAILRSPHAHARIRSVDASAALAVEGVRAVLTGGDVQRWASPLAVGVRQPMEHWVLAVDKVRYVGEPVAVVIAEDRYRAEDALDAIKVEYEPLPVVIEPMAATTADAPVLHEAVGSNVVVDREYRYGDPDKAFEEAPHKISLTVNYPRNSCTPIECFVVLAEYSEAEEGYNIQSNFQGPFGLHSVMARALKVPGNKLRLRMPADSGGSFGVKQGVFPYVVMMALAARKAGAPVKWVEDRLEHLQAATSATNRATTITAAVEADGRLRALSYDQIDDCGAYLRAPEPATTYRMHGTITGAYDVRNLYVRNRIVMTNKTPTGLVRGFGGPQVYFPLERLMQRIAWELGLDPLEVIRKNLVPADAFPYRAAAGSLLDSGNYQEAINRAIAQGGMDELIQRRDQARAEGRLYGIGLTAAVEPSISNMGYITALMTPEERRKAGPKNGAVSTATINVDPLGSVNVIIASTPQGQGHRTAAAQVVADVLGLDPSVITVNVDLDTQKDAWSIASGNYSSRFSGAVAGAVHLAAVKIRDRLAALAADILKAPPEKVRFAKGGVFVEGSDAKPIPFHRVAGATHWSPNSLPVGEAGALRETAFWSPKELEEPDELDHVNSSLCYGFIFDYCGVEVDRVTGQVRIDRYVTQHDAGRILNPAMVDGQVRGAFSQAVGAALYEEFAYGPDGSFLSGTFADYLVPTAPEVPDPIILHMETHSPFTPLGAKGVGEGNNMSTPVCIANAVADALGAKDVTLPLTPAKVRALIGIEEPPAPRSAQAPKLSVPAGASTLSAAGSIELPAPPEEVFKTLLDPQALQNVIPGCHSFEQVGEHAYRADVTVGVGLIKARYDARIELSELDPPHSLVLGGKGVGGVGSAEGIGRVTLEPTASGGTKLSYDYRAAVSGKVAAVGGRMLQGAARVLIGQLFERLGRQVGGGAAPPAAGAGQPSLWQRLLRLLGVRR
jgi:2-furoyl-CoA dehydrogenase large subunit